MAGSRRESAGTILSRLQGLLRSGAMKEEDRPIWYDVVKAFPPKPAPAVRPVRKILYPEDFIRVHFHKTFIDTKAVVLTNEKMKSLSERFVDKYLELQQQKVVPTEAIFSRTVELLKKEGVKLMTHAEKRAADAARVESMQQQRQQIFSPFSSTKEASPSVTIENLFNKEDS